MHWRFANLGKGLLKNLHNVTGLRETIPIPEEHHQCRVCSLSKMEKHKGDITERRPERLGLISIDICELPTSRLGYKYFLEIVNNFSRKKRTFPLKARD